jgi:hypothetical protein
MHTCTIQTTNWLCVIWALWCTDEPREPTDSQNSPQPELGGIHHLPPYSILCVWPRDQHPNVILSRDSQVWVPKFPKLGLLRLCGHITLCANLWLKWSLKKSCNPCQKLSNDMSHTTCTEGNWSDSRLLVVGSKIANLTPDPSFGHNLCLKCSNGSCELILDIYVPRTFWWYKELISPMIFDPCKFSLKFENPLGF